MSGTWWLQFNSVGGDTMREKQLLAWARRVFHCDSARLYKGSSKTFLIIGNERSSKQDAKEGKALWYEKDVPIHFTYLSETVIASGRTLADVKKSAQEYLRLTKMPHTIWVDRFLAGKEKLFVFN